MKKILFYNSGGGLGDSIQLFPLILSLKNHFKESKIYYLGAHENHFLGKLKEFNIKIQTLDLGLKYFGFRWWHLLFAKKRITQRNYGKFNFQSICLSFIKIIFLYVLRPFFDFHDFCGANFLRSQLFEPAVSCDCHTVNPHRR